MTRDAEPRRYPFRPHRMPRLTDAERGERGRAFLDLFLQRRSVRDFADTPVPRALVEMAVRVAGLAPSGANRQPWTFVIVDDPGLKRRIREAAEAEERLGYEGGRMPPEWLEALAPLGTDWKKPFLETAPYLVVVFRQDQGVGPAGEKLKNYYVAESVGIACGFFIAALHAMGLATLTHTPSPMGFLKTLLNRPDNEKPYILFPVGYPAEGALVPDIAKKPFEAIVQWNDGTVGPREEAGADARDAAAGGEPRTDDPGNDPVGLRPIDWCVRVAALAALGRPDEVAETSARALAAGIPVVALREALVLVVPYAGWPAALNALLVFAEVAGIAAAVTTTAGAASAETAAPETAAMRTAEAGDQVAGHAEGTGRPPLDREALRALGLATARRVNAHFDRVAERVAAIDPDIAGHLLESAYGAVYNRPGLTIIERELVAVGLLAVLRQPRQLVYHAHGALNVGATPADVWRTVTVVAGVDGAAAAQARATLDGRLEPMTPPESP